MDDPEALPRFLGIIAQETDRLARIVADLLELSRLESSGEVPSATPVSLRAAVDAAVQVVACRADAKGIHVSLGIPEDLPELAADESLVCQVLINLLTTRSTTRPMEARFRQCTCETRERVRVDVSDTDSIAPEHLPRCLRGSTGSIRPGRAKRRHRAGSCHSRTSRAVWRVRVRREPSGRGQHVLLCPSDVGCRLPCRLT